LAISILQLTFTKYISILKTKTGGVTMKKIIIVISIFILFFICSEVCAQDEEITLSTYYPAPYGEYCTLSVGDNYTAPDPTKDTDLVVEGNVGIGTISPGAKLHVWGDNTGTPALQVDRGATGQDFQGLQFWATDRDAYIRYEEDAIEGKPGKLHLQTYVNGGSLNDALVIDGNGNVGIGTIGTTGPLAKLHVKGSHATWKCAFGVESNAGTHLLAVMDNGRVGIGTDIPEQPWATLHVKSDPKDQYAFGVTTKDGTNIGTPRFVVTKEGDVGIGTSTPAERLHVDNNVRIDGQLGLYYPRMRINAVPGDGPLGFDEANNFFIRANNEEDVAMDHILGIKRNTFNNYNFEFWGNLHTKGKITSDDGIDPPYISFSKQSHESIRQFAKNVEKHEKVMQFWNGKTHRLEFYVVDEDKFYTITGELIE